MSVISIDIYSLMIILIISIDYLLKYKKHFNMNSYANIFLIISITIIIMFNIAINIFDFNMFILKVIVFFATNLALLCSSCIYIYVKSNILEQKSSLKSLIINMSIYSIIFLIISIVLFLCNDFMVEKSDYVLNVGKYNIVLLFIIAPLLQLLFETLYCALKRKDALDEKLFFALIIPIFGIIIDIASDNLVFWIPAYVLSFLIMYIYRNNSDLFIDPLTSLYNRRIIELDSFKKTILNEKIGLYYIDVDDFKKINDVHGHDKGDKILKDISDILKDSIRKNDYAVRIGGDEFLIIAIMEPNDSLNIIKNRIEKRIRLYNEKHKIKISISIGSDLYEKNESSFEKEIKKIDKLMYENKISKKLH